jgi:6-phosphogluconolactonase (cycloisomerase 2 family)
MIAIDSSDGSLGTATEYRFGKGACDGSVGEWKEGARFRQERCHPHGVVCDPINNNLFVADLGSNQVVRWINDTDKGMLHSPLGTTVHPFAGPRHLDFSPDGRMLYVTNELDNTVCVFRHHIDSSTLTLVQTLYSVPLDYLEENLMTRPGNLYSKPSHASELLVTQDGRFV